MGVLENAFEAISFIGKSIYTVMPTYSLFCKPVCNGAEVYLKLNNKDYKEERKIGMLMPETLFTGTETDAVRYIKRMDKKDLQRNEGFAVGIAYNVIKSLRVGDYIQVELYETKKGKKQQKCECNEELTELDKEFLTIKTGTYLISVRKFVDNISFKHFKDNQLELQSFCPINKFWLKKSK